MTRIPAGEFGDDSQPDLGPMTWKRMDEVPFQRNHRLKCHPHWFEEISNGRKSFDVRSTADRIFQAGDTLELFRWDPKNPDKTDPSHQPSGSGMFVRVMAVYHGLPGVDPGYCVMSIDILFEMRQIR